MFLTPTETQLTDRKRSLNMETQLLRPQRLNQVERRPKKNLSGGVVSKSAHATALASSPSSSAFVPLRSGCTLNAKTARRSLVKSGLGVDQTRKPYTNLTISNPYLANEKATSNKVHRLPFIPKLFATIDTEAEILQLSTSDEAVPLPARPFQLQKRAAPRSTCHHEDINESGHVLCDLHLGPDMTIPADILMPELPS